jgi:hypothetical protein
VYFPLAKVGAGSLAAGTPAAGFFLETSIARVYKKKITLKIFLHTEENDRSKTRGAMCLNFVE